MTSLGLIFVSSLTADRTRFLDSLASDCSILDSLASSRVILVTRGAFLLFVIFRRESSIDGLVGEHLLCYLGVLLQVIEEVSPASKILLAPPPGNVLGEVLGQKGDIFFVPL